MPGFTANHVFNFSNGYASSLATLELEAAVLSPVPTLMIRYLLLTQVIITEAFVLCSTGLKTR